MRPRISQQEAVYMVSVLTSQLEGIREKLEVVTELERDIRKCIYDLKNRVQIVYDGKGCFAEHRIVGDQEALAIIKTVEALRLEHPNLLGEKFMLWDKISVLTKLVKKYEAIAKGEPHDGRYKKLRIPEYCFNIPVAQ